MAELIDLIPTDRWHKINGLVNPVDCTSRGLDPAELVGHKMWSNGPKRIKDLPRDWPLMPEIDSSPEPCEEREAHEVCLLVTWTNVSSSLPERVSSYNRLNRIAVWMNCFIHNRCAHRTNNAPQTGPLTTSELATAEKHWIITVQGSVFPDEVATSQKGGKLSCNSKLLASAPISG